MAPVSNIQKKFFDLIDQKISPNISLAEVIANELDISIDSAYRRIRGESGLTFEQLKKLCIAFRISLDTFFASSPDSVNFNYRAIDYRKFNFESYFESIVDNLDALRQFEIKEVIYAAKEIPFFYYFMFPNLAAFKIFFWMRNIFHFPDMIDKSYESKLISDQLIVGARKVWEHYVPIPSTEIWSDETINTTIRQIDYYIQGGMFQDKEEVKLVIEDLRFVIRHLKKQAEAGCKFLFGKTPMGMDDNFKFYYNEVILSDNTVFLRMDDYAMVHLGHNVMNILSTSDPSFCKDTYNILNEIIRNSSLISIVSEKERNKFFNILNRKIDGLEEKID